MSYVDPKIKKQFDSLSPELQKALIDKDVALNNLQDLIKALETIAN